MKRDVGGIEEAEHDILWQHEYRSSCPSNSKRAMPAFSTCVAKAAEDRTDSSQACGRELMRKNCHLEPGCIAKLRRRCDLPSAEDIRTGVRHMSMAILLRFLATHARGRRARSCESTSDIPLGPGRRAQPQ